MKTPEDSLPPDLKGPATTITRIAAGLSGAAVYRVEAAGQSFVLKVATEDESLVEWRSALHIQQLAAAEGLAPRVVHVDELGRAVLSAFVVDRSFGAYFHTPTTREAALTLLGRTVRRIHALPLPTDAPRRDARDFLVQVWERSLADFPLPTIVTDAVERVLAERPLAGDVPPVLCHGDLNPSNLVYDGEAILMLDWAAAGALDAFYDLAVLSVFFRMDRSTSLRLLSAYEGSPLEALPERFLQNRRLAAALAGTMALSLARQQKHPGETGETPDATLSLGDFYKRLQSGALRLGTAEGQWAFGLALLNEGAAL
jgi:aminoglycoside phosphotransferase (APT) family kinase protein